MLPRYFVLLGYYISLIVGGAFCFQVKHSGATVEIKVVASDVDGTLLNTRHKCDKDTELCVKELISNDVLFFPATGKCREGALSSLGGLGAHFRSLGVPGVYSQGLLIYGWHGELIHEHVLPENILCAVDRFCRSNGVSTLAYSGDRLVCEKRTEQTDKIIPFGEVPPEAIGITLEEYFKAGNSVQKIILMVPEEDEADVRLRISGVVSDLQLQERDSSSPGSPPATITQAVAGMIEILPPGTSKDEGLDRLLTHLGYSWDETMAFGDAENDTGMLKRAKIGVAVANGRDNVKAVADHITTSNDELGVALALKSFFGLNVPLRK